MPQTTAQSGLVDGIMGGGTWEGAQARHEATGVRQPVRRRGGDVAWHHARVSRNPEA